MTINMSFFQLLAIYFKGFRAVSQSSRLPMCRSKVKSNLTIPSQEASECLFLSASDLKSYFQEKLNLFQYIS